MVSTDASGGTNTSATQIATAGDGTGGSTSTVGAPRNVRVDPNIVLGLSVWWDAPSSTPTGRTVNGYYVEYKATSDTTWTRAQYLSDHDSDPATPSILVELLASTERVLHNDKSGSLTNNGITDLDKNKLYRVRVVTELVDSATPPNKTTVNSAPSEQVRPVDDLQGWWRDDTPNNNPVIGRTFMMVDSNHGASTAICYVNNGAINCPPRTLVSLDTHPGGTYNIRATVTGEGLSYTLPTMSGVIGGEDNDFPVSYVITSAGDSRFLVRWAPQSWPYEGLKGWVVDVRSWDQETEAWTAWETRATVGADAREATFTGVPNDVGHEVRVRMRRVNSCDHDNDPMTRDEQNEAACGVGLGLWSAYGVTTEGGKTDTPGPVTNGKVSESTVTVLKILTVSWDDPAHGGEDVYGYKIRRWATGMTAWQEQEFYQRKMWRTCDANGACTNPRTVTFSGFLSNTEYANPLRSSTQYGAEGNADPSFSTQPVRN